MRIKNTEKIPNTINKDSMTARLLPIFTLCSKVLTKGSIIIAITIASKKGLRAPDSAFVAVNKEGKINWINRYIPSSPTTIVVNIIKCFNFSFKSVCNLSPQFSYSKKLRDKIVQA